ncbi:hypothetical protein K474DRAFT_626252 [Panus rudis PR-1116 ss-1]|nr:hypothetical protein K474DRAFT_626252 [Panus rudis PR-1116 ss-1]
MTDIAFDTTWCPVCSRQILPKRITVPATQPVPPPTTPAPPPSPTSHAPARRSKHGTIRARAGLVHGTGRVKPNGALKRSDPAREHQPPKSAAPDAAKPAPAVARQRTIIDQSPIPLYCSDECRIADLQMSVGGMGLDYNPDRHRSPGLPPVPHNSLTDVPAVESDSGSDDAAASASTTGSIIPPQPAASTFGPKPWTATSFEAGCNVEYAKTAEAGRELTARAFERMQLLFGKDAIPQPPPLTRTETASSSSSDEAPLEYNSGVMMAGRRIKEALCTAPPPKKPTWATPASQLSTAYAMNVNANATIPGWTDGSHAWRASVYSFAAPPRDGKYNSTEEQERIKKAYSGYVSTPLRSRGVYSTVSESGIPDTSSLPPQPSRVGAKDRSQSDVEELYNKFSQSLARRSESRTSLAAHRLSTSPTGSTRSLPVTTREVPLVAPGAEGRLLVPNVKMRRTSSGASESIAWSRKKSPLSRHGSEMSVMETEEEHEDDTMTSSSKPQVEARSWSYSDVRTYPILTIPKIEKRKEKRMVDGVEREVEVEVEVFPERKRLFLFADEPCSRTRR